MAFATLATPTATHLLPPSAVQAVRVRALPLASMLVCVAGLTVLVQPALRAADVPTGGPVSIQVVGRLSTTGLPESPAVSQLTVRNEGSTALSWSARPSVTGPGAAAVVVDTWLPSAAGCGSPGPLLTASDWSRTPLAPGQSVQLCARVRAVGHPQGTAVPTVTVEARPA
jgi:hypothetical protein